MHDQPPQRALPERTGKHVCIKCLTAIPATEYFRNDHICDECAAKEEYPVPAKPEARAPEPKLNEPRTPRKR
ncbi:MAG TPA: hypothetical protein VE010_19760 [Thermoanaerobaculia bacterium]|nr:hypothetical protein [Thermoanaerobaculia bacterium]